MKKVIAVSFAVLFGLLSSLSAYAIETTTSSNSYTTEAYSTTAEDNGETIVITDPSTEPEISADVDNTEESLTDDKTATEEITGETFVIEEPSSVPADEETTASAEKTGENITTIYVSGLSLNYVMKLKNTETKEVYEISLTEDNNWIGTFDGPEGTYKVSFKTDSVAGRAGNIYDNNNKRIKTITIKRTSGYQVIEISVTERATLAVGKILKKHWMIFTLLVGTGVAYIYLKKYGYAGEI